MKHLTFFDLLFLILMCVWVACRVFFHSGETWFMLCFIGLCLILYIFARKDLKDATIPHHWWIAVIPFAVIGIVCCGTALNFALAVIPAVIVLILGWFRWLNGADAFGIVSVLLVCSSWSAWCYVPYSWCIITIAFLFGLLLYMEIKAWREKGVRFLVPLCLSCVVFGILFI